MSDPAMSFKSQVDISAPCLQKALPLWHHQNFVDSKHNFHVLEIAVFTGDPAAWGIEYLKGCLNFWRIHGDNCLHCVQWKLIIVITAYFLARPTTSESLSDHTTVQRRLLGTSQYVCIQSVGVLLCGKSSNRSRSHCWIILDRISR